MKTFTDEEMGELLPTAKPYSVVILKKGPNFDDGTAPGIIWEHGRRNFGLRDDGVMPVVLPVTDGSDVCGICVFAATARGSRRESSPTRCTPAADSPGTRCPSPQP